MNSPFKSHPKFAPHHRLFFGGMHTLIFQIIHFCSKNSNSKRERERETAMNWMFRRQIDRQKYGTGDRKWEISPFMTGALLSPAHTWGLHQFSNTENHLFPPLSIIDHRCGVHHSVGQWREGGCGWLVEVVTLSIVGIDCWLWIGTTVAINDGYELAVIGEADLVPYHMTLW